ncbi:MAG: Ig-like domain-containing protein, partial [Pseudomonadota bacterium]
MSFVVDTQPANGVLTGTAPDLTYTPNAEFFGTDSFQFSIVDGSAATASAVIDLTVNSVNDVPQANPQSVSVAEDATVAITLTGSDADGDSLTYSVQSQPTDGTLSGSGSSLTYSPNANFFGNDVFTFVASDGASTSVAASVDIAVTAVNDAPVVDGQSVSLMQDQSISITLTGADIEGDALTFNIATPPANGALSGTAPDLTYTPNAGFSGADSFTFTANDGATTSATALVDIDVMSSSTNMAPQFVQLPLLRAEQGRVYRSQGEVSDPEGDVVTVSIANGPASASVTDLGNNRFELTWLATGNVGTTQQITLRADDGAGGVTDAPLNLLLTGSLTNASTLGTDFWLAYMPNGDYTPRLNWQPPLSEERVLQVLITAPDGAVGTAEIDSLSGDPSVGFSQTFDVPAGESLVIEVPRYAVARSTVADALHVTSDRPVTVIGFNWLRSSSDGWIALPTPTWGTNYQTASYSSTRGRALSQVGIISSSPGTTTVAVTPETGLATREDQQLGLPYTMVFDEAGILLQTSAVSHDSIQLQSDQPIAVLAGANFSCIPGSDTACDLIVEQLLPDTSLSSEYVVAPLATRANGSRYRVVATEDDTNVWLNGLLLATLADGEILERTVVGPVHVRADKPVLALQFSTSESTDDGNRPPGLDENWGDPFMLQAVPTGAFLDDYLVTVPNTTIYPSEANPGELEANVTRHFINILIRDTDAASLVLDGLPVDTSEFVPVGQTDFIAGFVELVPGDYRLAANGAFGLTSYGFGVYESYGYSTGLAFPSTETGLTLTMLSASTTVDAGDQACFEFSVTNAAGDRVPRARYQASSTGLSAYGTIGFADSVGIGQFCYSQDLVGQDTMTIAVDGDTEMLTVDWVAGPNVATLPPVFLSTPPLVLYDPTYLYDVDVQSATTGSLVIEVAQGPDGMQYDSASGQIVWTPLIPEARESSSHAITLTATNALGVIATQAYELTVHYPPEITGFDSPTTFVMQTTGSIESIGGDFQLTDMNVTNGPVAGSGISWIPGANSVRDGLWQYSVNMNDVQVRESFSGSNRLCVAPGSQVNGYQTQRIRAIDEGANRGLAVGPVEDSNNDGAIDNDDDIFAFAVNRNAISLHNLTTGVTAWRLPVSRTNETSAPVMANLDADPELELLVVARVQSFGLLLPIALDLDGTILWTGTFNIHAGAQGQMDRPLLVHDLDADGTPEIIAGGHVLDNFGNLLWQFPTETTGGTSWQAEFAIPTIADLDGDGQFEVMFSNQVRRADGSLYWDLSATGLVDQHALFGVGDLDADGDLEVVTVIGDGLFSPAERSYGVYAWEADGTPRWGSVASRGFSVPVIGDVDADGETDIYIADDQLVLSATGAVTSRTDGPLNTLDSYHRLPIIDLNGDGVYERFLHSTRSSFNVIDLRGVGRWLSDSTFGRDISDEELHRDFAIADVDHDGSPDMVIGSDDRIGVFESATESWTGTPRDYRQFTDISQALFGIDVPAAPIAAQNRPDYWIGEIRQVSFDATQV